MEVDLAQLGNAVYQCGNLFAKIASDIIEVGQGIFYYVVQQARTDAGGIQLQLSNDSGNPLRMYEIGVAVATSLFAVRPLGILIRSLNEIDIRRRVVATHTLNENIDTQHQLDSREAPSLNTSEPMEKITPEAPGAIGSEPLTKNGLIEVRSKGPKPSAADGPGREIGVYVHFPWCLSKCPYCDFFSVAVSDPDSIPHRAYAEQVEAELMARSARMGRCKLRSIYVGGGTPSLWREEGIKRVVSCILSCFEVGDNHPEITVECNPSSFDSRSAEALLSAGVNRISLGVQSLGDTSLQFLGRLHDARGARRALADALGSGATCVSADYIFGLPDRTLQEEWKEIREIADLGVGHLSTYALTIEQNTLFGELKRRGSLPLAPEDRVADSYLAIHEGLTQLGYDHYEISNHALNGERSVHNLGYWRGRDYLGLGVAAVGTVTVDGRRLRYRNFQSSKRYLAIPFTDVGLDPYMPPPRGPIADLEQITNSIAFSERILLGLRTREGLDIESAAAELGVTAFTDQRNRAIRQLVSSGRLQKDGERLWIDARAWLFADHTIASLL